jgi:hypothetical protein
MLLLLYERPPFHVVVAELRDRGLADPEARGLRVRAGSTPAVLAFAGDLAIVTLRKDGVDATLIGDLPPPELVRFAAALAAAARAR